MSADSQLTLELFYLLPQSSGFSYFLPPLQLNIIITPFQSGRTRVRRVMYMSDQLPRHLHYFLRGCCHDRLPEINVLNQQSSSSFGNVGYNSYERVNRGPLSPDNLTRPFVNAVWDATRRSMLPKGLCLLGCLVIAVDQVGSHVLSQASAFLPWYPPPCLGERPGKPCNHATVCILASTSGWFL